MKIPALLTLLLAAVLPALPVSQARADSSDVSFDVFYNSLGDQGDWYNTPEYGYVWQPSIAYQNDKWRPYSDGYWAQTDDGWTWVSYENFGWATYHYGRWIQLDDLGWAWVPGYQWGPGWVSWRTSDDYVGWAPLPPKAHHGGGGGDISIDYNDVEPADQGYTSNVDVDYDIGPSHYCFVPVHDFGAPVLVQVIVPPAQNITIIEHTTNVTNIVYQNGGNNVVVINNGPDFVFLSHHVNHPIQHLILEHHNDVNYLHEHLRGGNPTLVRNGTLFIPSPLIDHRRVNFTQVKPPTVKRDIRETRVDHGWRNSGADPATQQRLRNQFQEQAREHPTRPNGNPAVNPTPFAGDRGRDRNNNVPPTPVPNNSQPFNRTDDDRRARQEAAERDRQARDAARTNGTQPTPGPGPERERDPRRQPFTATPTPPENPRQPHQDGGRPTPTAAPRQQEQERAQEQRQQAQQAQDRAREQQAQQHQQEQERAQEQRQQQQDRTREQQQDRTREQQQHQQEQQAQQHQHEQEQRQQTQDRAREQQQQQRTQEQQAQQRQGEQRQAEQHQAEQRQGEQRQAEQRQAEQRKPEPQQQQQQQQQQRGNQPAKSDDDKKKHPDQ